MLPSSSNAHFAGNFEPTPPGSEYDQSAIYCQSLMAHVQESVGEVQPADGDAISLLAAVDLEDEYKIGSFVVDDNQDS